MAKRIPDLTGQKFENLTVVKEESSSNPGRHFLCVCDCGNIKVVSGSKLTKGGVKSCGNKKNHLVTREKDRETLLWQRLYRELILKPNVKHTSEYDDVISFTAFKKLITLPCFICGEEYCRIEKDISKNGELLSDFQIKHVGVDRIDPSMGYWTMNVIPCCEKCNLCKNDYSLLSHIKKCFFFSRKENEIRESINKVRGQYCQPVNGIDTAVTGYSYGALIDTGE